MFFAEVALSDTESFIDEVNEELQRDKLFAMFRKYGWIAVALVALAVGGAAYNEWTKARDIAAAQNLGDDITQALAAEDAAGRAGQLATVVADGAGAGNIIELLQAAELTATEDKQAALALLGQIANNSDAQPVYRNLAKLKAVILAGDEQDAAARHAVLDELSIPGNPFRAIAMEQKALVFVETGDKDAAITLLLQILDEPDTTQALLQRTQQLIVALGGELPQAAAANATNG